ncbi:MAG: Uma2 family endonuclease [Desulfotomaculales bacterium]
MDMPPAGEVILTYDDYLRLPDDGRRYEILEGVLEVTPSPTTAHQRVVRNLFSALHAHVQRHGLGEVLFAPLDVVLSRFSVTQPDLLYVCSARSEILTEAHVAGAPDLVVEVVSPSTSSLDRVTKAQVYARYGIPHYWVVDPAAKTVEEFRIQRGIYLLVRRWEGREIFAPALFPGLEIDLTVVFAGA